MRTVSSNLPTLATENTEGTEYGAMRCTRVPHSHTDWKVGRLEGWKVGRLEGVKVEK